MLRSWFSQPSSVVMARSFQPYRSVQKSNQRIHRAREGTRVELDAVQIEPGEDPTDRQLDLIGVGNRQ